MRKMNDMYNIDDLFMILYTRVCELELLFDFCKCVK